MRHHSKNKHLLASEQDPGDEAILVSANVEDGTVADDARGAKVVFSLSPRLPSHGPVVDMRVPSLQWPLGVAVARSIPELFQPGFRNNPHSAVLLIGRRSDCSSQKTNSQHQNSCFANIVPQAEHALIVDVRCRLTEFRRNDGSVLFGCQAERGVNLAPAHIERLNLVSRIEMGFPHDLFAIDMVRSLSSGGMRDHIDA
jgi:hypothetical protein